MDQIACTVKGPERKFVACVDIGWENWVSHPIIHYGEGWSKSQKLSWAI